MRAYSELYLSDTMENVGSMLDYAVIDIGMDIDAFWTGWVLAFYQWRTGIPFERFAELLPVSRLRASYHPLHELSEERVATSLDTMLCDARARVPTRLGLLRGEAKMTQVELARRSGVSLCAIQQYEQRVKDINRAQACSVRALARELGCHMEDLMEL